MDNTSFLQADYLDIIFDHRNKAYGGYVLRKYYSQRVGRASVYLLVALAVTILLSSLVLNREHTTRQYQHVVPTVLKDLRLPVVVPMLPPPAAPRHTTPPAQAKAVVYTPPVVTKDPIPDDKVVPDSRTLHDAQVGSSASSGNGNSSAGSGSGNGPGTITPDHKPAKPFTIAQVMPQFAGDMNGFLNSNLHYPDVAREEGISGLVIVRFVVNEDGSVSDAAVVRSVGGGCDEEALRIVRAMPRWVPGKQNGVPVKVYFTLPIKFVLN